MTLKITFTVSSKLSRVEAFNLGVGCFTRPASQQRVQSMHEFIPWPTSRNKFLPMS